MIPSKKPVVNVREKYSTPAFRVFLTAGCLGSFGEMVADSSAMPYSLLLSDENHASKYPM